MIKWTDLNRFSDNILAVWPYYKPLHERWFMEELVENGELNPSWRDRLIPGQNNSVRSDNYPDRLSAICAAESMNLTLKHLLADRNLNPVIKRSLELKIEKALQSKKRLADEEQLMLSEAIRRHEHYERQSPNELKLATESEIYREDIAVQLAIMPYLMVVIVKKPEQYSYKMLLTKEPDGSWSKPFYASARGAKIAERAKIANGFNMDGSMHWGKVKAEVRRILLPRANQLLQLASVQRLLAEAYARGERVLISNGIVFWYEDGGEIGWEIKETSSNREAENSTIWKEGTILSTNHGRLVILPYIKDDGEKVRGYTKNAPNDGRALPRHPDHYVSIPFTMYDGDLMIGLLGELPYE